jgi:cation transport ATPase
MFFASRSGSIIGLCAFFLSLPILLMSGMERKRKMSLMVKDNGKMKGTGQATDR